MKDKNILNSLSQHLFWDVNFEELEFEKSKSFIIKRVLEYGFMSDWDLIKLSYGLETIGEQAKLYKDLDPKSHAYISIICQIPINEFRCYTTKQLTPKHWSF